MGAQAEEVHDDATGVALNSDIAELPLKSVDGSCLPLGTDMYLQLGLDFAGSSALSVSLEISIEGGRNRSGSAVNLIWPLGQAGLPLPRPPQSEN